MAADPPAMIIELPEPNLGHSVAPRNSMTPFQRGGPSSGYRTARTAEWMPSAPTNTSPDALATAAPPRSAKCAHTSSSDWSKPTSRCPVRTASAPRRSYHRLVQDRLQSTAVNGELGNGEPCGEATRPPQDRLPEPVGVRQLGGPDGDLVELVEQAHLGQLLHGVRQEVDPDAQLAEPVALLVDLDVHARPVQAQRREQATYPGSRDDDLHDRSPLSCPRASGTAGARCPWVGQQQLEQPRARGGRSPACGQDAAGVLVVAVVHDPHEQIEVGLGEPIDEVTVSQPQPLPPPGLVAAGGSPSVPTQLSRNHSRRSREAAQENIGGACASRGRQPLTWLSRRPWRSPPSVDGQGRTNTTAARALVHVDHSSGWALSRLPTVSRRKPPTRARTTLSPVLAPKPGGQWPESGGPEPAAGQQVAQARVNRVALLSVSEGRRIRAPAEAQKEL